GLINHNPHGEEPVLAKRGGRLEPWPQVRCSLSSFQTLGLRPGPQDEVRDGCKIFSVPALVDHRALLDPRRARNCEPVLVQEAVNQFRLLSTIARCLISKGLAIASPPWG